MNFSGNMRRNNNKMPARGGGPLMTDHLHDLELELELLKRKRQLIQQQQSEMLYNRGPAVNVIYSQPQPSQSFNDRFNEPQHLNFSHLYNEAPRDGPSFGVKRRAEPEWSNAPGDRFNNPMGGNKRPRQSGPFNRFMDQNSSQSFPRSRPNQPQPLLSQPKPLLGHPKPLMGQPKPLMNFQSQPMRRAPQPNMPAKQNQGAKPLTHHPNFKRNKQAAPISRPGFTPNRNNAPFKKMSPVKPTTPNVKKEKRAILLADQEPSNKTNGRLELALGIIVKEIKLTYSKKPEYVRIFNSMPMARVMKQCIRERLHSVMTGKVVGLAPDIVAEYRQKYPLDTDKEIVDLAIQEIDQKTENTIQLLEEGDPEQFFKKNMNKLIDGKFGEVMRKLEAVVTDANLTTADILEKLPEIKKTPEGDEKRDEEETTASEVVPDNTADETTTTIDISSKEKDYMKWFGLFFERRVPLLMRKHKNALLRLFDTDQMFRSTKAAIIIKTNKKAQAINQKEGFTNASDPVMPRNLPYFAKVLAHPSIPKRKMMQEFLNQFNPKTIKRHKKNFNMLFIGFDNKEDYDKILAADQTVLGNATLTIAGNVVKATTVEIDDQTDIDQVLTPQLDDQINDLLSSIRKADEESKASGDTSAEVDLTADSSEKDEDKVEEITDSKDDVESEEANENTEIEKPEATNESEKSEADDNEDKNDDECQVIETNGKEVVTIEDDEVGPLKSDEAKAPGTPAKGRAPATPSSIRTRRSSRLVQN